MRANQTGFIVATDVNTGELSTKGVDVLANYTFEVGDMGLMEVDYVATFLNELETTPLPDLPDSDVFDCAGLYAIPCEPANPEYRHKLRATWETPWNLSVSATWRRYGEVDVAQSSDQEALAGAFAAVNETFDTQDYFDLSATYNWQDTATVTAGANNLLDNDPPLSSIVGTAPGNGNTFPQVYDAFGRYLFLRATYTMGQPGVRRAGGLRVLPHSPHRRNGAVPQRPVSVRVVATVGKYRRPAAWRISPLFCVRSELTGSRRTAVQAPRRWPERRGSKTGEKLNKYDANCFGPVTIRPTEPGGGYLPVQ